MTNELKLRIDYSKLSDEDKWAVRETINNLHCMAKFFKNVPKEFLEALGIYNDNN